MTPSELATPDPNIVDGPVILRLPNLTDDVEVLCEYARTPDGLAGVWMSSLAPGATRDAIHILLAEGRGAWEGAPSRNGRVLVLTTADSDRLIGEVTIATHASGSTELTYGVAPDWRGKGIATAAARLVATWLTIERSVRDIEVRIGRHHAVSRRVAEKAGFVAAGNIRQFVAATDQTYDDLRYVWPASTEHVGD